MPLPLLSDTNISCWSLNTEVYSHLFWAGVLDTPHITKAHQLLIWAPVLGASPGAPFGRHSSWLPPLHPELREGGIYFFVCITVLSIGVEPRRHSFTTYWKNKYMTINKFSCCFSYWSLAFCDEKTLPSKLETDLILCHVAIFTNSLCSP